MTQPQTALTTLTARAMTADDVPACCEIINHIIRLGGSTAHEEPFSTASFTAHYLDGMDVVNVVLSAGRVLGFQCASRHPKLPEDTLDIGTFTDRRNPVKGAGRALFDKTLTDVKALGAARITAHITSDNAGGLAYYAAVGFRDDHVIKGDFTRRDGTVVDRVVKVYTL